MPNILNGFTPGVYTSTSVDLPVDQVAGIFKTWNDRYLQGQEQSDKINQLMNTIQVRDADKAHRSGVENTVRDLIKGDDYASMSPNLYKAYRTIVNNKELNQAIKNDQYLSAQEKEIRDSYDASGSARGTNKSSLDYIQYQNAMKHVRDDYKGVGHYDPKTGDYVQGTDEFGYYDNFKTKDRTNYVDLRDTVNSILQNYKGGNTTQTTSQTLSNIREGLLGSKNIYSSTKQHTDGSEAAKMVSDGLLKDANSSAYVNDRIRIKYEDAGMAMPTGTQLEKERANFIVSYADDVYKSQTKDDRSTSQSINTSYDDNIHGKAEEQNTYYTQPTSNTVLPVGTSNVITKLDVPTNRDKIRLTGSNSNPYADTFSKPQDKEFSIPEMGVKVYNWINNLRKTNPQGYDDYIINLKNTAKPGEDINKLLYVKTPYDVRRLLDLNTKMSDKAFTPAQEAAMNPIISIPATGRVKKDFDMLNKDILPNMDKSAINIVSLDGQTQTTADKVIGAGDKVSFSSFTDNHPAVEFTGNKLFGPGLRMTVTNAKNGTETSYYAATPESMYNQSPYLQIATMKNDAKNIARNPNLDYHIFDHTNFSVNSNGKNVNIRTAQIKKIVENGVSMMAIANQDGTILRINAKDANGKDTPVLAPVPYNQSNASGVVDALIDGYISTMQLASQQGQSK